MRTLLIIDAQNDFMPGGSLGVPEGEQIIPILNNIFYLFDLVIFTKDCHQPNMDAFVSNHKNKKVFDTYINSDNKEDILWPAHCVQYTKGCDLHKDIDFAKINNQNFYFFKKGMDSKTHPYSGFAAEGLLDFLNEKNVKDVYIGGLALDFCVKDTITDSLLSNFNTFLIEDATKAINPNIIAELFSTLKESGLKIIHSDDLLLEEKEVETFCI